MPETFDGERVLCKCAWTVSRKGSGAAETLHHPVRCLRGPCTLHERFLVLDGNQLEGNTNVADIRLQSGTSEANSELSHE